MMAKQVVLTAEDWVYKCEGLGNVILSYVGSDSDFLGRVLRIRKCPREALNTDTSSMDAIYSKSEGITSREEYLKFYVRDVVGSLLRICTDKEYIDAGETIAVTREFLKAIKTKIDPVRSEQMLTYKLDFDINADCAILLRDFSYNRKIVRPHFEQHLHGIQQKDATLCVEIKPKWGMICRSEFIDDKNKPCKYLTCRYCMQQFTKLQQGLILNLSSFCPTNLFSNRLERITRGLVDLIENPQNNMRLYIDGVLSWFDDNSDANRNFKSELLSALSKHSVENLDDFIERVAFYLLDSNVMETVQRMQMLDRFDIEFIYKHVYSILKSKCQNDDELMQSRLFDWNNSNEWIGNIQKELAVENNSQPPKDFLCVCSGFGDDHQPIEYNRPYSALRPDLATLDALINECKNNEEFAWHILRMYLIAHGIKDCSVMMSFNLLSDSYDVGLVDLDPKIVSKVPSYYKMDQDIIELFHAEKK